MPGVDAEGPGRNKIRRFWVGIDRTRAAEATKLALRFSLTTAQRKGEVLKARWEHVDLIERVWTIPTANTKNKPVADDRIPR